MSIYNINNSIWESHDILRHMGYISPTEAEIDALYRNFWKLIVDVFEHDHNLSLEEISATLEQALEEIEMEKQMQLDKLEFEFAKIAYKEAIEDIIFELERITIEIAKFMLEVKQIELIAIQKELEIEGAKLDVAKLKSEVDKLEAMLKAAQARFKVEEAKLEVRKGEIEAQRVLLKKLIVEAEIQITDGRILKKNMDKLLVDITAADLDIDTAQLQIREMQEMIAIEKLKFSARLAELRLAHFNTMKELINESLSALQQWQASQLANEQAKQSLIMALSEIERQNNYDDKITPLLDALAQLSEELSSYASYLEKLNNLQKEATKAEDAAIKESIAAEETMTKAFEAKSKILGLANAFLSKYYYVISESAEEELKHYIGTG